MVYAQFSSFSVSYSSQQGSLSLREQNQQTAGRGAGAHDAKSVQEEPARQSLSKLQTSSVSISLHQYSEHYAYTRTGQMPGSHASTAVSQYSASAPVEASAELDEVEAAAKTNPFAAKILSFINAQLQRDVADGASPEELQSRLDAGLAGFQSGYGDALEQLKAGGFLSEDLEQQIQSTYDQVIAGLNQTANDLGLELKIESPLEVKEPASSMSSGNSAPAPSKLLANESPNDSIIKSVTAAQSLSDLSIIESLRENALEQAKQAQERMNEDSKGIKEQQATSYAQRYDFAQSKSFNFSLTTADGDKVSIKAYASSAQTYSSGGQYNPGEGSAQFARAAASQSEKFEFSVEGNLDEGELRAINDLLSQVNDIAQTFYQGGVEEAFNKALELGYDSDEISQFALNLQMTSVERVANAYEQGGQNSASKVHEGMPKLANFLQKLNDTSAMASRWQNHQALVESLLDQVNNQLYPEAEGRERLLPFAQQFLKS